MSVTGIVAALTAEARTLGPVDAARAIQSLGDGNLLIISGMGPAAAAQAAAALAAAGARSLLSFGLAGALDPTLRAGTVLIPEIVMDGHGHECATHGPWRDQLTRQAARIAHPGSAPVGGALLGVAQPLVSAQAKAAAWTRTGARAIDMESFAIGTVAAQQRIPFAVARVVIDQAADTVPPSVTAATGPRGEVSWPRLVAGLLAAPVDVAALIRLASRYRAAMRALRHLGRAGVGAP